MHLDSPQVKACRDEEQRQAAQDLARFNAQRATRAVNPTRAYRELEQSIDRSLKQAQARREELMRRAKN